MSDAAASTHASTSSARNRLARPIRMNRGPFFARTKFSIVRRETFRRSATCSSVKRALSVRFLSMRASSRHPSHPGGCSANLSCHRRGAYSARYQSSPPAAGPQWLGVGGFRGPEGASGLGWRRGAGFGALCRSVRWPSTAHWVWRGARNCRRQHQRHPSQPSEESKVLGPRLQRGCVRRSSLRPPRGGLRKVAAHRGRRPLTNGSSAGDSGRGMCREFNAAGRQPDFAEDVFCAIRGHGVGAPAAGCSASRAALGRSRCQRCRCAWARLPRDGLDGTVLPVFSMGVSRAVQVRTAFARQRSARKRAGKAEAPQGGVGGVPADGDVQFLAVAALLQFQCQRYPMDRRTKTMGNNARTGTGSLRALDRSAWSIAQSPRGSDE